MSPNSRQFPKRPLVSPRNYYRNSTLMTRHYPVVTRKFALFNQNVSITQIWVVKRHQYGFFCSFFRRHFAEEPVKVSRNVGCCLALGILSNDDHDVTETLSRPLGPAEFVKCRGFFRRLNSKGFYQVKKEKRKFVFVCSHPP